MWCLSAPTPTLTNNKFHMQQSQNNPLFELFLCVFSKDNNGVVQTWDFILKDSI